MTEIQIVKIIGVVLLLVAVFEIVHLLFLLSKRFSIIRLLLFVVVFGLNVLAGYGIWMMSFRITWPSILPFLYLLISTLIYIGVFRKSKMYAP